MIAMGIYYVIFSYTDKIITIFICRVQCTKVIDDECDYYQSNNVWLTTKHREKLQKLEEEINERKRMSRLNRRICATFDFTGREVIEEDPVENFDEFIEEQLQDIPESLNEIITSNICSNIEYNRPMVKILLESC